MLSFLSVKKKLVNKRFEFSFIRLSYIQKPMIIIYTAVQIVFKMNYMLKTCIQEGDLL